MCQAAGVRATRIAAKTNRFDTASGVITIGTDHSVGCQEPNICPSLTRSRVSHEQSNSTHDRCPRRRPDNRSADPGSFRRGPGSRNGGLPAGLHGQGPRCLQCRVLALRRSLAAVGTVWLSATAADGAQADHRRKERPDRRQLLDPVPQHQELQRPGVFLHALLLVALRRGESRLCRPAAGFAPLGPEQAFPDGDPVRSGCGIR